MAAMVPPPPPPMPDLNAVYRPDQDAGLQHSVEAAQRGDPAALAASPEARGFDELLGLAPQQLAPPAVASAPPVARPQQGATLAPTFDDILGLPTQPASSNGAVSEDILGLEPAPAALAVATGGHVLHTDANHAVTEAPVGGLLAHLPPGVPSAEHLEKPRGTVDLSSSAPVETPAVGIAPTHLITGQAASASSSSAAGPSAAPRASAPAPRAAAGSGAIPADAKGFGSEDLFGGGSTAQTLADEATGKAKAALATAYGMLPENVKEQAKQLNIDCTDPSSVDQSNEVVISPGGSQVTQGANGLPGGVSQQHAHQAVNRACTGKWVPTYMRHQMAQNGHLELPSASQPNAHEYRAEQPPPSVGQALGEMGEELGEQAQTMFAYIVAYLSSVATHVQMCSHQTVSLAHEQVISGCENVCSAATAEDDQIVLGRPLDEGVAGFGPLRSQVRQHVPMAFPLLVDVAKRRLVTPEATQPQFLHVIKTRDLQRQVVVHESSIENWLLTTEINKEAVSPGVLTTLCQSMSALVFQETWHVEMGVQLAEVEISSARSNGPVTVVIRATISGKPDSEGGGCEVDSRLYVMPRDRNEAMPVGLVEQLAEVQKKWCEVFRGLAIEASKLPAPAHSIPGPSIPSSMGFQPQAPPAAANNVGASATPFVAPAAPVRPSGADTSSGLPEAPGTAGASVKPPTPEGAHGAPVIRPPTHDSGSVIDSKLDGIDSKLLMQMANNI